MVSRELRHRLSSSSLSEHTGYTLSLTVNYKDMYGMFLFRKAHLSVRIWDFYGGGWSHVDMSCFAVSYGTRNSGAHHQSWCLYKAVEQANRPGLLLWVHFTKPSVTNIKKSLKTTFLRIGPPSALVPLGEITRSKQSYLHC